MSHVRHLLHRNQAFTSKPFICATSFSQKFSGLSLPSGCSYLDFSDPEIFLNTPPCPTKSADRKPVFRLNVDGDFECMVGRVGRDRSRSSEKIPYLGLSDSFKLSGQSSPTGSGEGGKERSRRVTFGSMSSSMRDMGRDGDCLHVQPEEVDRVRRSEYLAKYDEIVGTRKDTIKRESKRDPTLCSDADSESPTRTATSTSASLGPDKCSQRKTCSDTGTPPRDKEVSEAPVEVIESVAVTPSPTPSIPSPPPLPLSLIISPSSVAPSAAMGGEVTTPQ